VRREYPDNPLIGVGAVIVENDRVLLIKRGQAPLLGEWSLPGGLLECGETLREAVVREVREETSLKVEPGGMLGIYERIIRAEDARIKYHYVLIDYLCRPVAGTANAGSDAVATAWFTRDELSLLNLPCDTSEVLLKGLGRC